MTTTTKKEKKMDDGLKVFIITGVIVLLFVILHFIISIKMCTPDDNLLTSGLLTYQEGEWGCSYDGCNNTQGCGWKDTNTFRGFENGV